MIDYETGIEYIKKFQGINLEDLQDIAAYVNGGEEDLYRGEKFYPQEEINYFSLSSKDTL